MSLPLTSENFNNAFENSGDPFLFYYGYGPDKSLDIKTFTRVDFMSLALKAASILLKNNQRKGSRILHCFNGNDYTDLAFRAACAMIGTIPVTVNWQADTIETIIYKFRKTESSMVIFNHSFDSELLDMLRSDSPETTFFNTDNLENHNELTDDELTKIGPESTKIIVFTSGTTGKPKGVQLSYKSFDTAHASFEQMLGIKRTDRLCMLVVNPLHHVNSSVIADWAINRQGSHLHLIEKYTTVYWSILRDVVEKGYDRIIAPVVSRHFDFLDELMNKQLLPVSENELKTRMSKVDFLIGSAPVGPTTIDRILKFSNKVPPVRFGSTETCLQVLGIPDYLDQKEKLRIFRKGWNNEINGENISGYYVGRPHKPYTEVRVVKSINREEEGYLEDQNEGIPGYLITRGNNIMSGYVNDPDADREVFDGGWYLGLKDIFFFLKNELDNEPDYFWMSRDSSLLIKGGANYSCDQIGSQLRDFFIRQYQLPGESFDMAVLGVKVDSEHEDACCVTIDLKDEAAIKKRSDIEATFLEKAGSKVSKGARPDYLRFSAIPRNFKGAILMQELKKEWFEYFKKKGNRNV